MPRLRKTSRNAAARLAAAKADLAEVQLASARAKLIALEADLPDPSPKYMSYKDLPPPSPEEAARFRARFDRMVDARVKDRLRTLFEDSRSGLSAEARARLLSLAFESRQT